MERALNIFVVFVIGLTMNGAYMEHENNIKNTAFLSNGQYSPKYIAYNDDAMMEECEKHGLIYWYEDGTCVSEEQFDTHMKEQDTQWQGLYLTKE
jgi:hypothetical protein